MSGKMRGLFMVCLLGFLCFMPSAGPAAPGTSIYLKASFRDALDGNGMPADKIRSDGKGFYQNAKGITVMINGTGELVFDIGATSDRRMNFLFDSRLRIGACAELPPDTAGTDPLVPDEPVKEAHFTTHMESYMAGPKVNLQNMRNGDMKEIRLWVVFTTALRSFFYVNYDQQPFDYVSGFAMVRASDTNGDNIVDRWVFSPKPSTNDRAYLKREAYTGKNRNWCDIGDFQMPFELTLDRL